MTPAEAAAQKIGSAQWSEMGWVWTATLVVLGLVAAIDLGGLASWPEGWGANDDVRNGNFCVCSRGH